LKFNVGITLSEWTAYQDIKGVVDTQYAENKTLRLCALVDSTLDLLKKKK